MLFLGANTVLWSVLFAIIGIVLGVAAALFVPIFGYKKETFIDEENIEENKKIDKSDVDFSKF